MGLQSARPRLIAGSILGLAMIPLFIAAVNLTWLRDRPHWESCLSKRIAMVRRMFAESPTSAQPADATSAPAEPAVTAEAVLASAAPPQPAESTTGPPKPPAHAAGWGRLSCHYLDKLLDAFNPVFGLLAVIGLISQRRLLW